MYKVHGRLGAATPVAGEIKKTSPLPLPSLISNQLPASQMMI